MKGVGVKSDEYVIQNGTWKLCSLAFTRLLTRPGESSSIGS